MRVVRGNLEPTNQDRELGSDYGVHASVLRKPKVIAEHPLAFKRVQICPRHGGAGELLSHLPDR